MDPGHLDEKQLADFAAGRAVSAEHRSHVEGCASCRSRVEDLHALGHAPTVIATRSSAETEPNALSTAGARPATRSGEQPTMLTKGTTIGRYVLLERLGSGGMGEVYAAYDPQLDRKIALKLLRAGVVSADEGKARLIREAQAMARLNHPNVIAVHDVGNFGDRVFVAMEFVDGETLSDWLRLDHSWR